MNEPLDPPDDEDIYIDNHRGRGYYEEDMDNIYPNKVDQYWDSVGNCGIDCSK